MPAEIAAHGAAHLAGREREGKVRQLGAEGVGQRVLAEAADIDGSAGLHGLAEGRQISLPCHRRLGGLRLVLRQQHDLLDLALFRLD